MTGKVVVNNDEWQAFLLELSKLEANYEIILRQLDATRKQMTAREELLRAQIINSSSVLTQIRRSLDSMSQETERELDAIE